MTFFLFAIFILLWFAICLVLIRTQSDRSHAQGAGSQWMLIFLAGPLFYFLLDKQLRNKARGFRPDFSRVKKMRKP